MSQTPLDIVKPDGMPSIAAAGEQEASPLVLVHIPRTAGTTLAMILRYHYRGGGFQGGGNVFARSDEIEARLRGIAAKPHVRAVSGHMTFGLADQFLPSARYLVILRDPVDRTLSHYSALLRARPASPGVAVRRTGFLPAGLQPAPPGSTIEDVVARNDYIPDNLQTWMLCGVSSPYDELPADALERSKRNLRKRFAFVGTTERFDALLALLNLELDWPAVAYRRSRAKGRATRDELTPRAHALIEERNTLDRELYAYAAGLLDEALERAGPELTAELEVVQEAGRRWSEWRKAPGAVEIRSLAHEARVALALKEAELTRPVVQMRRLERAGKALRTERRQRGG